MLCLAPSILLILAVACSLPGFPRRTPAPLGTSLPTATKVAPTATSAPTATVGPLPPALVESDPPPGSEIPLFQPITFYFNQPMDHPTVEGALNGQPTLSGHFSWANDRTLTFTPDKPFLPDTDLEISIGAKAQSHEGLEIMNPITLSYKTAGYLRLTHTLPAPDTREVSPIAAIVATFNRSIIPLGSDTNASSPAFSLKGESGENPAGHGEWVNTSTYIFYPEPPLAGGETYTVEINRELKSVEGSPLETEMATLGVPYEWSFTTADPRLVTVSINDQPIENLTPVGLDPKIKVTFNQPMAPASVEEHLVLLENRTQEVPTKITWNEDQTEFTLVPADLLNRSTEYTISTSSEIRSGGGTPLKAGARLIFRTVGPFFISASEPGQDGEKGIYDPLVLHFSAPVSKRNFLEQIQFAPEVPNLYEYLEEDQKSISLSGEFAPATLYTLTVSTELADLWGDTLDKPYVLHFRTKDLDPNLFIQQTSEILYLTTHDNSVPALVTNLTTLPLSMGNAQLEDFITMLGPAGYEFRQSYKAEEARLSVLSLNVEPNKSQRVDIDLTQDGTPLEPGLYYLKFDLPSPTIYVPSCLIVVSNIHLTFKISPTDALVWAVDVRDNTPVANVPVLIYDENGSLLAPGETNEEGLFYTTIPELANPYQYIYAVLGQPGDETFGLALSSLNYGVSPGDFGLKSDFTPPGLKYYLYTDRPVYRPGQEVYFRGVVRDTRGGVYMLPGKEEFPGNKAILTLYDDLGQVITDFSLPLSAFGTVHGSYLLPTDIRPGFYRLGNDLFSVSFQVADYRKPDINLQVKFDSDQSLAGEDLSARVSAHYFFDAPVADATIHWALYSRPSFFDMPGYSVGPEDDEWLTRRPVGISSPLGDIVEEGEAKTDVDGLLELRLPTKGSTERQTYTLEVTAQDESGLPVSSRSTIEVNPALFYIGVRPDKWIGQAASETDLEVRLVDWLGASAGVHHLRAEYLSVTWVRQEDLPDMLGEEPVFIPQYIPVGSTDFTTAENGIARVGFVPPAPGTYIVSVKDLGTGSTSEALTRMIFWVGGSELAAWPDLPNQRLQLTADKESYLPGDVAQIFIPNPFRQTTLALVTLERSQVIDYRVVKLEDSGWNLSLQLEDGYAPNVYLSVTLLGMDNRGRLDFRQGYLNILVEPVKQTLSVALTTQPERAGPGDPVTVNLRVTDASGAGVQGEFSLAVVDLAALALAEPNAPAILPFFYGEQPLQVRTAFDLVAYTGRKTFFRGGIGGGEGGEGLAPVVREKFPDTAYWNAQVVTDENGEATVELLLPDSLTTWHINVRGLTIDTQVGEAESQVITTKEIQVRPVTPRFLVAGDHLPLSAMLYNNSSEGLQVEVSLKVTGFTLDEGTGDPEAVNRQVIVPAGGRVRLNWWGTVQEVDNVEAVISAKAGNLQDVVRLTGGTGSTTSGLPVLRFATPVTFATSGELDEAGKKLELVSLPREVSEETYPQGSLRLTLSPSLAAVILNASQALEHSRYESNEETLSKYLTNLETYRSLQSMGIQSPELELRYREELDKGLNRLIAQQDPDGGWSWWPSSQGVSDPYVTSYIVFGLSRAQQAGVNVKPDVLERAVNFLFDTLPDPQMLGGSWQLDRLAFQHFALAEAGNGSLGGTSALYEQRDRLSPWAKALLALALEKLSATDATFTSLADILVSDVESQPILSATSVHWEDAHFGGSNMTTPVFTTSVVIYALGKLDPASNLLPAAVQYLMAHRQATTTWASSYETAWTVLGLIRFIQGTGEVISDYPFHAELNSKPIAEGGDGISEVATIPVTVEVPASELNPQAPNALIIQRDSGQGILYYSAYLRTYQPVGIIEPLNQGVSIYRNYYPARADIGLRRQSPIESGKVGELVTVRLTLVLPNDAYYMMVEDFIPAGTEILDTSLKTSRQGAEELENNDSVLLSSVDEWVWWNFHQPMIYADHITWVADYLPAGTYELTYTLVLLQAGEYLVLPAHAWQLYFPEVQGNSAGGKFMVRPSE